MNKSQTIVFCAQQRSGTTVLQRAFEETGIFKNYREIFHDLSTDNPDNHFAFFNFKRHLISNQIDYCFPSEENQNNIFNAYFNQFENQTQQPYNIVDIKYNSWHHLNPVWHSAQEIPALLRWIKLRKIPIIHIVRENLLHQFISHRIANSTGKWHYDKSEIINKENTFYINPDNCLRRMRIVNRDVTNFKKWLASYPFNYLIKYEDLISNNSFTKKINDIVSTITKGQINKLGDPPLKKGTRDPFKLIKNKDELFRRIKKTQFSNLIE